MTRIDSAERRTRSRHRRAAGTRPRGSGWADLLALVAGVGLVGTSIWPTDFTVDPDAPPEPADPGALLIVRLLAGTVAIVAVLLGQRWERRGLARGLLVGAALLLVAGLAIFRDFSPRALGAMALPAVALLVSATAVGPLPPEG